MLAKISSCLRAGWLRLLDIAESIIRTIAAQSRWFLSIVVLGITVPVALLLLGPTGGILVPIVALSVSIMSLAVAVRNRPVVAPPPLVPAPPPPEVANEDDHHWAPPLQPNQVLTVTVASLLVFLVGAVPATTYALGYKKLDYNVTEEVRIDNAAHLMLGGLATMKIGAAPAGREFLSVTFRFTNPSGEGNCEEQSQITLTPLLNGARSSPYPRPIGTLEPIEVRVDDAREVGAILEMTDFPPGCELDLSVADAVYYNKFP